MLDILFLSFTLVQSSYFFGGAALVRDTEGLTLAEFARRGFFELVAVALLLILVLLLFDWMRPKETRRERMTFGVLAGCAVLLIFPIIASAMHRMVLYRAQFGLTQSRLYTTAFMFWLIVVFLWFAVTVLRDRRERFAFGAFLSACLTIVALHAINPDALIVRTNIARGFEGRELDASYLTTLSWDAVPAIVENVEYAPEPQALRLRNYLGRRADQKRDDWRTWSYGYLRGRAAVAPVEGPVR
jgi:hypothetical protein